MFVHMQQNEQKTKTAREREGEKHSFQSADKNRRVISGLLIRTVSVHQSEQEEDIMGVNG